MEPRGERGGRMPPGMGAWQPERPLHGWVPGENTKNEVDGGNGICPFPGWRAEEALLHTQGIQGVGFGAAAGGAGHGQDGRRGEQEGGAAVEQGVARIQAERRATHVLAQ
jgi:hypothetical protein